MPAEAGGCFVQGGTVGNLSALVAARHGMRERHGAALPPRLRAAVTDQTHSSVVYALRDVMDVDPLLVQADERGRMTGPALREALQREGSDGVFTAVATSGTTNLGVVDDLAGIAEVCREFGLWFHVDGAYGGAAPAAPPGRPPFTGIEHAPRFLLAPPKKRFGPLDSCALGYRDPPGGGPAHPPPPPPPAPHTH